MDQECSVDGCERPAFAREYCRPHYARWRKHGDPGPAEIRLRRTPPEHCVVEGCGRKPHARGLCNTHHARWSKHGDPGDAALQRGRIEGVCTVEDCAREVYKRQLCRLHYERSRRYGNPLAEPSRPANESLGYMGVHHRLRERRGAASDYSCAHCGRPAADWAYDHLDPNERRQPRTGRPYSLKIDTHYIPLCASCHKKMDLPPVLTCAAKDCERPHKANGLCDFHYKRWWRAQKTIASLKGSVRDDPA